MSEPLISGYTTGAATHVFTSQLQHITGLGSLIKVPAGLFKIPRVSVTCGMSSVVCVISLHVLCDEYSACGVCYITTYTV